MLYFSFACVCARGVLAVNGLNVPVDLNRSVNGSVGPVVLLLEWLLAIGVCAVLVLKMKLRAVVTAEQEELRWKAAAGALHRQQEVYLRVLERTAGLAPLRASSTANGVRSDHILAL